MKIKHPEFGEVEGVEPFQDPGRGHGWNRTSYGRIEIFYFGMGWAEVQEPRWVDVTGEVNVDNGWSLTYGGIIMCTVRAYEHRFQKVDRYALPEDIEDQWIKWDLVEQNSLNVFLRQFKQPCLIIQRKETS